MPHAWESQPTGRGGRVKLEMLLQALLGKSMIDPTARGQESLYLELIENKRHFCVGSLPHPQR